MSKKCPKYITVNMSTGTFAFIDTEEELQKWLKDGSLSEGDRVYEVDRVLIVGVSNPKLELKFLANHGED